jgi:hypothetical protein
MAKTTPILRTLWAAKSSRRNAVLSSSTAMGTLCGRTRALESDGVQRIFTIMTDPPADLSSLQADLAAWRTPSVALLRDTVIGTKPTRTFLDR